MKLLIYLRIKHKHGATRIANDYPEKEWDINEKKLRTEENIELREEMILSQEDQLGAHPSLADIAREPDINRRSVSRVID